MPTLSAKGQSFLGTFLKSTIAESRRAGSRAVPVQLTLTFLYLDYRAALGSFSLLPGSPPRCRALSENAWNTSTDRIFSNFCTCCFLAITQVEHALKNASDVHTKANQHSPIIWRMDSNSHVALPGNTVLFLPGKDSSRGLGGLGSRERKGKGKLEGSTSRKLKPLSRNWKK